MAGNVIEYVSPSRAGLLALHSVSVFTPEMVGREILALSNGGFTLANAALGANFIVHHPITLPSPFVINQFWWNNGTTVAGNTDIGIYSEDGAALLVHTGPIANSGANARQVADISDFTLQGGKRYWLSLGTDSATHQYIRMTLTAPAADYVGIKSMTSGISGSNLVTPATFAVGANTCVVCGMTGASVF